MSRPDKEAPSVSQWIGAAILAAGSIFGVMAGVPWPSRTEVDLRFRQTEKNVEDLRVELRVLLADNAALARLLAIVSERQQRQLTITKPLDIKRGGRGIEERGK